MGSALRLPTTKLDAAPLPAATKANDAAFARHEKGDYVGSKAGFEAAVTTEPGVSDAQTDPMQLPRFSPWERDELRFTWRLVQNAGRKGPLRT